MNNHIDRNLFTSFVPTVKAKLNEFTSQGFGNIAWAYAVANVSAPTLFNDYFVNICLRKKDELSSEGLCQLHQWNLWQEELNSNIRLPLTLEEKGKKALIGKPVTTSAFQDYVVKELTYMGFQPEEEVLTETGYRLDVVVEVNGKKIAIEVDGPSHFLGQKPNGSTVLKRRQVAILDGMQVVSVPYFVWDRKIGEKGKKREYLRDLLGLS